MAKISVIVPVYNVENYLERCIDSILNQSFKDFKLILVNDGSTDISGEICETYRYADERIELIEQENMGLSVARNTGLQNSSEKYVTFIDSDDYIHRDMLSVLYENLIENDADISVVNHKKVYEGRQLKTQIIENDILVLDNIEATQRIVKKNDANMIVAWGKLYDRRLFKDITYPSGKYHEDEFVTYKLLYRARKVVVSLAKLYYYTQREKSITGDKYSLKRLEKLEGLKEAITFFKDSNERELELDAKYRYLLNLQIAYYRVKFELSDEASILRDLKSEYDENYKFILSNFKELSLMKKMSLKLFYTFPIIYCFLVKFYMSISRILPSKK